MLQKRSEYWNLNLYTKRIKTCQIQRLNLLFIM